MHVYRKGARILKPADLNTDNYRGWCFFLDFSTFMYLYNLRKKKKEKNEYLLRSYLVFRSVLCKGDAK